MSAQECSRMNWVDILVALTVLAAFWGRYCNGLVALTANLRYNDCRKAV